jgi:transcriptional regulator with XRE-family HTH domain
MPLLQQDRLKPMPRIPMTTDESNDDHAAWYAAAVGARLRSVRRQKRLSLQAVEASSAQEFKASVLGAYERGERSISVPRLQRLALLYDVPVDQLLPQAGTTGPPERGAPSAPAAVRSLMSPESKISIDLVKLNESQGPERDLLRHFLASVQVQRQDFNGRVITIRGEDLRVMSSMFGRSVDEMTARLEELTLVHRD